MKTKLFLFLFFFSTYCFSSNSVALKGVLNDISKDEAKILYTCKDNVNEAYSGGSLFIYDIQLHSSLKIAKISAIENGIKSYFIGKDSVLIISNDGTYLYNIKMKKIVKTVVDLTKITTIVSTKKNGKDIVIASIDYDASKLKYYKLCSNSLNLVPLYSGNISILPTDNFFDCYSIDDKIFQFANRALFDVKNKSTTYKVAFNDTRGEYLISSNKNSICFVEKNKNNTQVKLLQSSAVKSIPVVTSNKGVSHIAISPIISSGENLYILTVGKNYYTISNKGVCLKTNSRIIYFGKKIKVSLIDNNSIEIK